MADLDRTAAAQISKTLPVSQYVEHYFPGGEWGGDVCGCTDDRCTGSHHATDEPCGCVGMLIDMARESNYAQALADLEQARQHQIKADAAVLEAAARAKAQGVSEVTIAATSGMSRPTLRKRLATRAWTEMR